MGQCCIKGAICPAHRKGKGLRFPYQDKALDGNVSKPADAGGGPGKSSLFFLTARRPWNRVIRRQGSVAGKASHVSRCPERYRRSLKMQGRICDLAWSYSQPHQVSKVNSLQSIEQCRQGKSAKWIRNFGKRIGSEGWVQGSAPRNLVLSADCPSFSRGNGGLLRAQADGRRSFGAPQATNSQLRTGTDKGNPTVQLKQSFVMVFPRC
eukprot:TRINITY_DN193_c14_g1_i1.p2 TRINITY_DN193_c14_g1~~TRINITY_DN193_c14_g1_i1.p2  ORF type:complete len:208 (-),score=-2.29 TRINITY_DN193_c14_g1_i1:1230-1853(-)